MAAALPLWGMAARHRDLSRRFAAAEIQNTAPLALLSQ